MSVASVTCRTVFEADLPTVSYEDAPTPAAAHEALKQARQQFPIAMGSAWARDPELRTGAHRAARSPARSATRARPRGPGHLVRTIVGPGNRDPSERQR